MKEKERAASTERNRKKSRPSDGNLAAASARALRFFNALSFFPSFRSLRILDFTQLLPGPYATKTLADMGARVTRVELPYFKDKARDIPPMIKGMGSLYWLLNHGKKSLCFDFKKLAGRKRLERLVKKSDVLIQSFRPGAAERLGLGYEALHQINPRLIYCSISGYSPDGPWRRKAGHDLNFLAMSGFLGLGNSERRIAFPSTQIADLSGSSSAVAGILAALFEREKTGRGRHIQISMADVFHSWLAIPLAYYAATGRDPAKDKTWWDGSSPFYRLYETKDGRFVAVAAIEKSFSLSLLSALGLSDLSALADHPEINARALSEALGGIFKKKLLADWRRELEDKDVCATPVLTLSEAVQFFANKKIPSPKQRGGDFLNPKLI